VIYTGKDLQGEKTTIEYSRKKLAALHQDFRSVYSWFVNDRYWLLFPLYPSTDTGVSFTQKNSAHSPFH
jgi:hypothetical protein